MEFIVADSCSLILLAKCGLLGILSEHFSVLMPQAVFNEVVNKDTIKKFEDAKIISSLVSEKKVRVVNVKMADQKLPTSIDRGEMEALLLAKQTANSTLATDDGKAIKVCRYLNLPFIISPKIAIELYRLGMIDFTKSRSSIEKMRIIGRYSPEIIAEAILELEVIKHVKTSNG